MAKAVMTAVDLQPIDRLEEKVKLLVGMIDRLRADSAKAADENARLRADSAKTADENARLRAGSAKASDEIARFRADSAKASDENARLMREVESLRARVQETEGTGPELAALREERDLIRTRVGQMLSQIDSLNL